MAWSPNTIFWVGVFDFVWLFGTAIGLTIWAVRRERQKLKNDKSLKWIWMGAAAAYALGVIMIFVALYKYRNAYAQLFPVVCASGYSTTQLANLFRQSLDRHNLEQIQEMLSDVKYQFALQSGWLKYFVRSNAQFDRKRAEKILEILLYDLNQDINASMRLGDVEMTPLALAVFDDKVAMAKLLMDRGAGVNVGELINRLTPLMYATSAEMVELLLDRGARIDDVDQFGFSVLDRLLQRRSPHIVDAFLDHPHTAGQQVRLMQAETTTPLLFGMTPRVCSRLLSIGAQTHNPRGQPYRDAEGIDVLSQLMRFSHPDDTVDEWEECLTQLLRQYNACELITHPAVFQTHNYVLLNWLIDHGVGLNASDENWSSLIDFLLNRARWTDCQVASLVLKLVDAGVNVNQRNHQGRSALSIAIQRRFGRTAQVLLKGGAVLHPDDFTDLAHSGTAVDLLKEMARRDPDVLFADSNRFLMEAAKATNSNLIEFLFDLGLRLTEDQIRELDDYIQQYDIDDESDHEFVRLMKRALGTILVKQNDLEKWKGKTKRTIMSAAPEDFDPNTAELITGYLFKK